MVNAGYTPIMQLWMLDGTTNPIRISVPAFGLNASVAAFVPSGTLNVHQPMVDCACGGPACWRFVPAEAKSALPSPPPVRSSRVAARLVSGVPGPLFSMVISSVA